MKEVLIEYIQQHLLRGRSGVVLTEDDDLLGGGLVDSMGMMKLIAFIEKQFEVSVPPQDMIIENFMSVHAIVQYLEGNRK